MGLRRLVVIWAYRASRAKAEGFAGLYTMIHPKHKAFQFRHVLAKYAGTRPQVLPAFVECSDNFLSSPLSLSCRKTVSPIPHPHSLGSRVDPYSPFLGGV